MIPLFKRLLAASTLLTVIMAGYIFVARPYQLHWGATKEEIAAAMPGDELDTKPDFSATRAITIKGTPQEIYPWLIQMGYNRAGFYAYDILENLGSEQGLHSAERILTDFQDFQVGDEVLMSSVSALKFYAIEPDQYLTWSGTDGIGGFLWAVEPIDEAHTRLISRIRWSYDWTQPQTIGLALFTEFTDHLAVREVLQGVKGRVEGTSPSMARQNTKFFLFLASAFTFSASLILLLVRPLSRARWLAGLGTGVAWLLTWYAPIPLWLGFAITVLALVGLSRAYRKPVPITNTPATSSQVLASS